MNEADIISELRSENNGLKKDNAMLQKIVDRLRVTLNRLISRYISDRSNVA